jgi:hypothetical protein
MGALSEARLPDREFDISSGSMINGTANREAEERK